jgi:capsular polysaccharide biosynthesis protein
METVGGRFAETLTLDQFILRGRNITPEGSSAGFYQIIPSAESRKAAPMLNIPGSNDEHWAGAWHMQSKQVQALGCYLADGIHVARDGYLLSENAPISQEDVVVPYINQFIKGKDFDAFIGVPDRPVRHIDRPTLVAFDRGYRTYGHVLIDMLPRILIFQQTFPDCQDCQVLLPHDFPNWGIAMLRTSFPALTEHVFVNLEQETIALRRAIIPTHCHGYYLFHPFGRVIFDTLRRRAVGEMVPLAENSHKRIFISRRNIRNSSRFAEEICELEEFAASRGFFVFCPEQLEW